eukprot:TRINITY_DN293_c0_g1_i9.p1 TRINITY_DN293_c0_g1~~TRINITY_DN293_c0_g1_i9.p1  ORF type:complete len:58 (+),score=8.98 TRINITY_DN293_c0_g1_i9:358-531(+)
MIASCTILSFPFTGKTLESDSSMMLKSCPDGDRVSRRRLQEANAVAPHDSLHNNARS